MHFIVTLLITNIFFSKEIKIWNILILHIIPLDANFTF